MRKFRATLQGCTIVVLTVLNGFANSGLTIYNQNFAVVRDTVALDLSEDGRSEIEFTDITAHLEPESVILRDPINKHALRIVEQNYRSDPVSQNLLLSIYEGKNIDFLHEGEVIRGKIIRSGYVPHPSGMARYGNQYNQRQASRSYGPAGQPIIEVEGKLRFSLPGLPLFPALADDSILKPTLHWIIESDTPGAIDAELCYITGGMSWEADYNLIAPEQRDVIDLIGWVTMDNQSGKTFQNARIKLMAGDVSKIQEQKGYRAEVAYAASISRDMSPAVSEKAFDEFHLYTLHNLTTLNDRETKQVEFVRAAGVQSVRIYVYNGAKIDLHRYGGYSMENIRNNRDYGTQSNPKVWVIREFDNSKQNDLGIPLPKGRLRFYRSDDDGQLEFIGENIIDHTPKDETIQVHLGNAFDLVGERRRLDYKLDTSRKWLDESFEIKLRNHKEDESVEIRVVENLYRWTNWQVSEKSDDFLKTDSQTIEFRVQVPPDNEKVITYKVHYTW